MCVCLTFQSNASASNPTHIDRGGLNDCVIAGQNTAIPLRLWTINYFGDDWPLSNGWIDIYCHDVNGGYISYLGYTITNNFGEAPYKVGADLAPGHIYNLTFRYNGDPDQGYDPCESYVFLRVKYPAPIIKISSVYCGNDNHAYLSAKLLNSYNNQDISGKTVHFKYWDGYPGHNFVDIGSAVTDANGIAIINYNKSVGNDGNIIVSYDGDDWYDKSINIRQLYFNKPFMKLTVDNVTSFTGKTVNLTAHFTTTSAFKAFDGTPIAKQTINFKIDDTFVGSAVTDSNGTATLPYNITQHKGNHNIYAYFYDDVDANCIDSGNLNVNNIPTAITVNNITACYGSKSNLTAVLTDNNGVPLANKLVKFKVNNRYNGSALTDDTGTATLTFNIPQTRTKYDIEADFNGDNLYEGSVGTGMVSTNPNTTLTVENISANYGNQTYLTAKICNSNGIGLANKNIAFKINNTVVGSAITNSNGIAVLNYNINQTKGNYTIEADFTGDGLYNASNGTGTLCVNTLTTILQVNNITTNNGKTIQLMAQLTDQNGTPLTNRTVTFKITNKILGTAVTDSNGTALLNYTVTQTKGKYTLEADFAGDLIYDPSTDTGTLQVNTIPAKLLVNNITANNGKTIQLIAQLTDQNGNPLTNEKISFKINNTLIGTVTTNSSGFAILDYLVKLTKGQYSIVAQFDGDDVYSNIQGNAILKVK